jgi:hypothetical protein
MADWTVKKDFTALPPNLLHATIAGEPEKYGYSFRIYIRAHFKGSMDTYA